MMSSTRRALLFALAALLVGLAFGPSLATAQVQVPNPTPRPQVTPNPKAVLPAPEATSTSTSGKAKTADIPGPGNYPNGRVIILRGLGNVFSRGMDQIAKDLKARGVNVNLQNHSRWQGISAKLIEEYRANPNQVSPIILIGHSLGGDASIVMSNWLTLNRVPVRFVVIFDAVGQIHPVNAGVQELVNFYKAKGYGQEIKASPNFTGNINNIDLTDRTDIDHLNIDKDPVIQAEVIASVMKIIAEANGGKPARKSKPAPVAAAEPPAALAPTASAKPEEPPAETAAADKAEPATPEPASATPDQSAAVEDAPAD